MSLGLQGCEAGQHGKIGIWELRVDHPEGTDTLHACAYCAAELSGREDFDVTFLDYRCPECDRPVDGHEVIFVGSETPEEGDGLTPAYADHVGCTHCSKMVPVDEAKRE